MSSSVRCVLIDDELQGLSYLKLLCEQVPGVEVVAAYDSAEKFLSVWQTLDFDVCIADIEMPLYNGLQLAKMLAGKMIIFVTAYAEYAADAFDLNAIDYIRKPVNIERLQLAISKAIAYKIGAHAAVPSIVLNTDQGKWNLDTQQVILISTSDNDSRDKIVTRNGLRELTIKNISFDQLTQLLPPAQFIRISKREMVNRSFINTYTSTSLEVVVENGQVTRLTVGEAYKAGFKRFMEGGL